MLLGADNSRLDELTTTSNWDRLPSQAGGPLPVMTGVPFWTSARTLSKNKLVYGPVGVLAGFAEGDW